MFSGSQQSCSQHVMAHYSGIPLVISIFDLFKIGIGPSSSHTVGPMLAASQFVELLAGAALPSSVHRISVELFGSLALTGLGHRTDRAVIMGLFGERPRTVDPEQIDARFEEVEQSHRLAWHGEFEIEFDMQRDLIFNRKVFLPQHPNGLRFSAFQESGEVIVERDYFSVGGGFVVEAGQLGSPAPEDEASLAELKPQFPYPFTSADELLQICRIRQLSIEQVVQQNELVLRSASEIEQELDEIWATMKASIDVGCRTPGILPGGLGIRRRAPEIYTKLAQHEPDASPSVLASGQDPLERMDWVTLFALAVNEQNAAGGRVVTAPTNGAAGVIPAVLGFYEKFDAGASRAGIHNFLKTAAAIGMLYKRNASLSAAEMGCQGEVGVACSMAAAGLAAVMGGTPSQIENAAEIGMEHNLGLTCDPIAGLVQVPCIERNTMGAVKAINAARLAVLYGDGTHRVSLDRVIETMRQTGIDMQSKYKETSLGGLAVNVINC
jgi:L-serine dehydratase